MTHRPRPGGRTYRRTRLTAALAIAALAGAFLLAPASEAQESPRETGEIRNGRAKAVATIGSIAPGVGNLALGMTTGVAVTQITNSLAQATSQAADLGLIGSSLTAENCRGSQSFKPEDLPQPVSVDNRGGDASATGTEMGSDDSPLTGGDMAVAAAEDPPEARARTTGMGVDLSPAARLGGGEADAATRVLPGEGREALARVRATLELGGAVELDGMRWRAHHRTGTDPHAEGTFSVGEAAIGGVPFPTDDLGALEDAVNRALAPSGIRVTFPRVERFVEPNDLVRVTPLLVELRDSDLGKALLGPGLDATRAQRNQAFDDLVAIACDMASLLLVADVVVSVIGGTGFLTIGIGGVEASSSDLELIDPFGALPDALGAPAPDLTGDLPAPGGGGGGGDLAAPPSGATPGAPLAPGPGAPGTAPTQQVRSTGPVVELCESLHPRGASCTEGAAGLVGALGLLATIGVAGADTIRQRRRAELEGI